MMELMDTLVGPMGKEWCYYFYWVAIVAFAVFVLALVHTLMTAFDSKKKFNFVVALNTVFTPFVSYLLARLYYNMCSKSL